MISDLFKSIGINTKYVEDGKRARSDCGFHSLRHTFVTMLRAGGATLQTAKAMAGHHTERMTEHYTHEDGSATLALPDFSTTRRNEPAKLSFEALKAALSGLTDEQRKELLSMSAKPSLT